MDARDQVLGKLQLKLEFLEVPAKPWPDLVLLNCKLIRANRFVTKVSNDPMREYFADVHAAAGSHICARSVRVFAHPSFLFTRRHATSR